MVEPVGIPFVSESYDRLRAVQLAAQAHGVPEKGGAVERMLDTPIATSEAFRAARVALNWSQQALADALGLAAPQISNIETEKMQVDKRTDLALRALLALRIANDGR
jgi:ribosome-binding protein aMBF1 (putative translation factor)